MSGRGSSLAINVLHSSQQFSSEDSLMTSVRYPKGTQNYRDCPHNTARQTVECSAVYFNSAFKKHTALLRWLREQKSFLLL